jgi:hypothetical protein
MVQRRENEQKNLMTKIKELGAPDLENAWLRESKSYNAEICLLLLNKR